MSQKEIIFVPDQNLGSYVASQLPDKKIYLYSGFCPIHHACTPLDVQRAKKAHPGAIFLAHPECRPEVLKLADRVGSTAAILEWVEKSAPGSSFLIGTEEGVVQRIRRIYPDRNVFLLRSGMTCVNMKKTTLEDVANSLQTLQYPVEVDPEIAKAAKVCLDRMVTLGSQ
jgi:quinolinate synthase